jgi:hypothetical protein
VVVVAEFRVIVHTANINYNVERLEDLKIPGTDDWGFVVERKNAEEIYSKGFIGLEGTRVGAWWWVGWGTGKGKVRKCSPFYFRGSAGMYGGEIAEIVGNRAGE